MKQLLTLLVLFVSIGVQAQQEWFLRTKPLETPGTAWAQRDGIAFSVGDYIIFGLGYDRFGDPSNFLKKYHPATNTFSTFNGNGSPQISFSGPCYGEGGIGFAIADTGYMGLGGITGGYVNDVIFRYTLAADNFNGMSPITFPGGSRMRAISFVINDKAYIGGGSDASGWSGHNDLWEYSPMTGWAQRANMPAAILGGTAFELNGKGYVIGNSGTALWSYDPNADTWTIKAPYPGGVRNGAVALVKGGKAFVGTGSQSGIGATQSFFAYDALTDSWSVAPALWAATGRSHAISVSHGNKAYLINGELAGGVPTAEIWELGPNAPLVPGTWVQRPYLPAAPRESAVAFSINDLFYLTGGNPGTGNPFLETWVYDPLTRNWSARAPLPATALAGVQAASSAGGKGYVLVGAATDNFIEYDPVADMWTQRADLPGGARTSTTCFELNGQIYISTGVINGVRQGDTWAYDPQTDSWEQRASLANGIGSAAAFAVAGKGYVSGGSMAGSITMNAVRCYNPMTNSWSNKATFLAPNNIQGHMAFAIGNRGYRAGGNYTGEWVNAFHSYDPVLDTWTIEPTTGGGHRRRGAAGSAAGRGYLSCGNLSEGSTGAGIRSNDLWEFIPLDYTDGTGVSGTVYFDADQDCTMGAGDVSAHYRILKVQPGGAYASTDQSGNYFISLPAGSYTLEQVDPNWIDHCNPVQQPFTVVAGGIATTVDFPDTINFGFDLGVIFSAGWARPGLPHQLAITAQNLAPMQSGTVIVQLDLDPNLIYISAVPPPTSVIGTTLTWSFPEVLFTSPMSILVNTLIPTDVTLVGTQLVSTASVSSTEPETYTANNTATVLRIISNSFDPNIKVAHTNSGSSDIWLLDQDEFIDYTIHFQNTGTDTAFTVVITDTLPQNLEPGSITMGAGSHPFTWKLSGQGILEFTFDNILLPDSNVNETASHGFVGFRILPRLPLLPGEEIENIANIYFDFNDPVITEPSVLTAEFSTTVTENGSVQKMWLMPNPTSGSLEVQVSDNAASGLLQVASVDGRVVLERRMESPRTVLDVSELSRGLYILNWHDVNGTITTQRFVRE